MSDQNLAAIRGSAELAFEAVTTPWGEPNRGEAVLNIGDYGDAAELVEELARDVLLLVEVAEAAQAVAEWRNFRADYATTQDIAAHASDFTRLEQALTKLCPVVFLKEPK